MNEELLKAVKAKLNNKQRTEAVITKATTDGLGEFEVEAIVSTTSIDRTGEVLNVLGLDTANYEKNGVVLWAHQYDQLPVAKLISLTKTQDGELIARFRFAVEEYPFALTVYNMIKGGYLSAVSIGFIPFDYDFKDGVDAIIWTKSEMLEFSIVPVPANPEALITAKGKGLENVTDEQWGEYREWLLKSLERRGDAETVIAANKAAEKVIDSYLGMLQKSVEAMQGIKEADTAEIDTPDEVRKIKRVKKLVKLKRVARHNHKIADGLIAAINALLEQ